MRRRIIRGFFIGVLLLCAGTWGWSHLFIGGIGHTGRTQWFVRAYRGAFYVSWDNSTKLTSGWEAFAHSIDSGDRYWFESVGSHALGFSSGTVDYVGGGKLAFLGVPWWLPTLLSAVLLWLGWRKTRPSINSQKTFPVELAKPSEKS